MFIIYGVRTYGAVDCEDGTQHATRFVHIYYLPLIPMGGVILSPDGQYELPASMSLKSVALAYARFWGFALAIGLGFQAYFELEKSLLSGLVWTAITAGVLVASLGAHFWAGVRRKNNPVAMALAFALPLAVLGLATVGGIKENLGRQVSKYSFDSTGRPSEALLAFAEEQAAIEKKARLEKQQQRCDSGEGSVCNDIGYELAKTDRVAAVAAYKKGCDLDFGMSCFNLALNVGKTEPEKAPPLYERSCELGYGDGCNNLATDFEKSDRKRAMMLFDKACKLESQLGCKNLARLQTPVKKKTKRG